MVTKSVEQLRKRNFKRLWVQDSTGPTTVEKMLGRIVDVKMKRPSSVTKRTF